MFKSNQTLETEGVWFDISKDTGFLVRRLGGSNKKYEQRLASRLKPFARQIQLGTYPEEKKEIAIIETFVETCLVDWKGVEIDGKLADFDIDTAKKLLLDPTYRDLVDALVAHANDAASYKEVEREELGNS